MGLKLLVNATEDFTGEFRKTANTQAQWKMNDSPSGDDTTLHDSSGHARNFTINGWSGTTASTRAGKLGKFFRFNTVNPATEKNTSKGNEYRGFLHSIGKKNRGRRVDIPNYLFGRDNICTYFQYQKRSGKSSVLSFPSFRKITKYAL